MSIFGKKKKTYADRNPNASGVYATLSAAQKKVLDDFSYMEAKNIKAADKVALQRIAEEFVIPQAAASSEKEIKRQVESLYRSAIRILQSAELTTNVEAKLFALDDFYNGDGVKTVWTFNTGKGDNYYNKRQKVEEKAFGFTIDWSVPIRQAAMARPVYAGLNYVGHPYGCATAYGSVVLAYKPSVIHRSTFLHKDTYDNEFSFDQKTGDELQRERGKICTWAQMGILVSNLSKSQLKALLQEAQGTYVLGDYPPTYIEAQILGGIEWPRDLAEIRVATTGESTLDKDAAKAKKSPATLKYLIGEFAKKYNVTAKLYSRESEVEQLN
jgi:hypothetical protein